MCVRVARVFVITAVCLAWLAGCETWKTAETSPPDPQTTGSIGDETPGDATLSGDKPADDLNLGKKYYRAAQYGLAEKYFRRAVESNSKDAESWLGLAASYDRLKRFDLADRAYEQAAKLVGVTTEILNNQGYSYMLRGDHHRARAKLLAAQARDPTNPFVKNNLDLLDESFAKAKAVR